jgi:arylsulfatase A-like enzyme
MSLIVICFLLAAMVSKLDQSVGEVMAALRTKGMLHNSIVLFMSDNGAPTFGIHSNRGSNFPLKGVSQNEQLEMAENL